MPRATKRTVVDDVIIPQGPNPNNLPPIPVKAGETVAWSDYVHARTPAVWGEDCEQFKPERFIGTDEVTGKRSFIQHGQVSSGCDSSHAYILLTLSKPLSKVALSRV